jgi:thiamine-phosphate pyrophosphorylase
MLPGPVLRILDANANRAREALRTMEDYARFILNHDGLSAALKALRHELRAATAAFSHDAILWRDTPGDVGTDLKAETESSRPDAGAVAIAAGKRLGEALRVIEEYLKIADRPDAAAVERLRYRFYELEQTIQRAVRPVTAFAAVRLYVLVTEAACRTPWLDAARQAILGGADCLQLREKALDGGEFLRRARQLVDLCRRHDVLSIINDRPDIALLSGADGVHLGQQDLPPVEARRILGRDRILGVSTHHIDQARQAVLDSADYIAVGPIFPSPTKPRDFVAGPAYAAQVAREVPIPCVAIAGITQENVADVMQAGVSAVAVTAAVMGAQDVRTAAASLKQKILSASSGTPSSAQ